LILQTGLPDGERLREATRLLFGETERDEREPEGDRLLSLTGECESLRDLLRERRGDGDRDDRDGDREEDDDEEE
jgi:hypothetical protein